MFMSQRENFNSKLNSILETEVGVLEVLQLFIASHKLIIDKFWKEILYYEHVGLLSEFA